MSRAIRPTIPSLTRICQYCGKPFLDYKGDTCDECEEDKRKNPEKYERHSL